MPSEPPAKFFVNQGVVSSREDMLNLLRPLAQADRHVPLLPEPGAGRARDRLGRAVVVDQPEISTYFTPIAVTLNVDSFEHLEFETRPDQLLVYDLVQGDERVVIEFAPVGGDGIAVAVRARAARVRHVRLRADGAPGLGAGRGLTEPRRPPPTSSRNLQIRSSAGIGARYHRAIAPTRASRCGGGRSSARRGRLVSREDPGRRRSSSRGERGRLTPGGVDRAHAGRRAGREGRVLNAWTPLRRTSSSPTARPTCSPRRAAA